MRSDINSFLKITQTISKLQKKLLAVPVVKSDQDNAEQVMLHYLAELGEKVEEMVPDHEGALSEKLRIAKQIVEDERLLSQKGILSVVDPDARFGWKSHTKSRLKQEGFEYNKDANFAEEQIEFELSDTFKKRIKRRPIIEHKNAGMKRFHGMNVAKYRGLFRMRIQAYLTAFVVNVRRMVKLKTQKQPAL